MSFLFMLLFVFVFVEGVVLCKLCETWSHIYIKNDENGVLEGSRGGLGSSCGALGAQDGTRFDFLRFCVTFS